MNKPVKANDTQRAASDPRQSVWVTANAGSGKTHVLAHRVIRLMLHGADPASILCLTYTKAAAVEMAQRVHEILSSWVTMTKPELAASLESLGVPSADAKQQAEARRLFTRALETPGGLKIQTIHAFCERLLQLFPVEAGVVPGFSVADERTAARMMENALEQALAEAESGTDVKLAESLAIAARYTQSSQLAKYVAQIASKRSRYSTLQFGETFVAAGMTRLRGEFQLSGADTDIAILGRLVSNKAFLGGFLAVLRGGGSDAKKMASNVLSTLESEPNNLERWREAIFTKSGAARSFSKDKALVHHAEFNARYAAIAAEIAKASACECLCATQALLTIAVRVFEAYDAEKRRAGFLDFDDLILRTQVLLTARHAAQWVLYKLDAGLSHVLVDEAQDTNPGQWKILGALTEEFFAGEGRWPGADRTIFVVGDRKQSIYSFQGADVNAFESAKDGFAARAGHAGQRFAPVPLTLSFRSTREVLTAVDFIFGRSSSALPGLEGANSPYPPHQADRAARGLFEIWPLVEAAAKAESDVWQPLLERPAEESRHRLLARRIASQIGSWIGRRTLAEGGTAKPEDVLILLRKRGRLFEAIIAELQSAGVPVAGADRLKLENNIAVLDLMALMQFCLLPDDDYSLACILKSPLAPQPLDEDRLLALAAGRGPAALWSRLAAAEDEASQTNTRWLVSRREAMRTQRPYEFLSQTIIQRRAAILARLGFEAEDAMNALLQAAIEHEAADTPSYPGFLRWFRSGETAIKRDMDQAGGGVRVMTIHGSKGLEAPIVILPVDVNAQPGGSADQILMPEFDDFGPFPFWHLSRRPLDSVPKWKDSRKYAEQEEAHRLLYVALTRARDGLYVCGCGSGSKAKEDNWYDLVDMARPPDMREIWEDGVLVAHRLGNDPANTAESEMPPKQKCAVPAWFHSAHRERSRLPSHADSQVHDEAAAARGTILHKLLQELTSVASEKRAGFAARMADKHGIDPMLAGAIANITLDIAHRGLFDAHGLAEAPVSASLHGGRLNIAGRIDRLVLGDSETVLIDYKSGRPVSIDDSHGYALQLAGYRAAMEAARPGKPVKAALLWIDAPRLDWIGKDVLDRALARLLASTSA